MLLDFSRKGKTDGKVEQERNRIRLLLAIYNHKWLTVRQLGVLGWPRQSVEAQRVSAFRFIKTAIKDGLLLERKIERLGGTIAALSKRGARWMGQHGYSCIGAEQWGEVENGTWFPASNYFHDFMINEFLIVSHAQKMQDFYDSIAYFDSGHRQPHEFRYINERELKKSNKMAQVPDGVVWDESIRDHFLANELPVRFIECESYRKTGRKMNKMLTSAIQRYKSSNTSISMWLHPLQVEQGIKERLTFGQAKTVFIYDVQQRDERGYRIDHKKRIVQGVHRLISNKNGWWRLMGDETRDFEMDFAPFDSVTMQFLPEETIKVRRPGIPTVEEEDEDEFDYHRQDYW
ncbi:hypothetical protein [Hydromonas duriensis]|uniref:Protein involved in plasmid replication-relaxation n=1 Tax=Hydromonas duriensis TaxID=1527608 RepID=A0A4R6Y5B6_9BURK|nr:hypothetical protein [Hydromonas duriensis]TDR27798.1 hypothetical protein DFR44_1382 [Hydromonas duriensis]